MKKRNSWFLGLAAAALLIGAQTVQAGSVADGAYVGISGGLGTAIVDATVTENESTSNQDTFSFADGGLGLQGESYGAFMGYGFQMDSLYVGMEVDSHWGEIKLDPGTFTIADTASGTSVANTAGGVAADPVSQASADLFYTGGVSGRFGIYTSPGTLVSFNAGVVGSAFDVSWDSQAEEYWDIGTRYGIGIDTAVVDGLSFRVNWSFIDYYDAEVFGLGTMTEKSGTGVKVEIQPTLTTAHMGLLYTF